MAKYGGALDSILGGGIMSPSGVGATGSKSVARPSLSSAEDTDIYFGEASNKPDLGMEDITIPYGGSSLVQPSANKEEYYSGLTKDVIPKVFKGKLNVTPETKEETVNYLKDVFAGNKKFSDVNGTFALGGKIYKEYPITDDLAKSELGAGMLTKGTKLGAAWYNTIGFGIDITHPENRKSFVNILAGMGKPQSEISGILSGSKRLSMEDMVTSSNRYISKYRQDVFEPFLERYGITGLSETNKQKMFNLFYRGDISTSSKSPYKKQFFNMFKSASQTGKEITWEEIRTFAKSKGIGVLANRMRNILS